MIQKYLSATRSLAVVLIAFMIFFLSEEEAVRNKTVRFQQYANSSKLLKNSNATKKDRAALFSQPRIFPFLDHLLNPFNVVPEASPGISPVDVLPAPLNPAAHGGHILPPYPGLKPDCAADGWYCQHDTSYPSDRVESIVSMYYEDVRTMYSSLHRIPVKDLLQFDNRTHRYRDGGHFVCESKVHYVRPGWARNLRGEWLAIINTESFPQVVRIEECKYASRRCEYLPPCYKSTCIQRYSFEKLLSVDPRRPRGRPFVDVFEIPSACSCFVENFVYY